VALSESGIDPVVGGLAIGLVTSASLPRRTTLSRAVEHIRRFREQPTPELARTAQRSVASALSPNERLEYMLHRWTSYLIVPMFALANAGIQLNSHLLSRAVGYVWRHLPLTDVHPHAQLAAEAAAAQGKFWGMHDELIAHQGDLTARDLTRYAETLGLDTDGFSAELRTGKYAQRVAEDVATADASGVTGTPSFFINGKRHHGSYEVVSLASAVRAAQSRATARAAQVSETASSTNPSYRSRDSVRIPRPTAGGPEGSRGEPAIPNPSDSHAQSARSILYFSPTRHSAPVSPFHPTAAS
jgi:2-hydroxychromene-2-carboxylate isomerase